MMKMQGHGTATPPEGYLRRLEVDPGLSLEHAEPAVLPEGQGWWDLLDATHRDIHGRFRYVPDAPGADTWEMPRWKRVWQRWSRRWTAKWHGDCEDFIILMRRSLLARGLPVGSLRIATAEVTLPGGAVIGHAVLTAEFETRTVIIDVRKRYVQTFGPAAFRGYRWLARQVPGREAWEDLTTTTLADVTTERTAT